MVKGQIQQNLSEESIKRVFSLTKNLNVYQITEVQNALINQNVDKIFQILQKSYKPKKKYSKNVYEKKKMEYGLALGRLVNEHVNYFTNPTQQIKGIVKQKYKIDLTNDFKSNQEKFEKENNKGGDFSAIQLDDLMPLGLRINQIHDKSKKGYISLHSFPNINAQHFFDNFLSDLISLESRLIRYNLNPNSKYNFDLIRISIKFTIFDKISGQMIECWISSKKSNFADLYSDLFAKISFLETNGANLESYEEISPKFDEIVSDLNRGLSELSKILEYKIDLYF